MSVTLTPQVNLCPKCGTELTLPAVGAGQHVICAACRHRFVPTSLAVATQVSGKAVASLVLGLASFLAVCLTGLLAVAFGIFALVDIRQSRGRLTGTKISIAGIVLGATLGTVYIPVWLALGFPLMQILQSSRGVGVAPVPPAAEATTSIPAEDIKSEPRTEQ
jgi:uncharacterized paraquat-inducible protein A